MPSLTEHEKRILDLIQSRPDIVGDKEARKKVAAQIGMSEKTLRNRIADLKRYGLIKDLATGGTLIEGRHAHDTSQGLFLENSRSMGLSDFLSVIWRRHRVIAALFLTATVFTGGISLMMAKTFASKAVIMVRQRDGGLGLLGVMSNLPLPALDLGIEPTEAMTFLAILQSRTLMESVIDKFNLIQVYSVANIEDALAELNRKASFELEEEGTIAIRVIARTGWLPNPEDDEKARQLSAEIANHFVSELDRINKELDATQARFERMFIGQRYAQNLEDLKNAEEMLKAFQQEHNMIALPEQTQAAIEAAAEIQAKILLDEVRIKVLGNTLGPDHPELGRVRMEILELRSQLKNMADGSLDATHTRSIFPAFSKVPEIGVQFVRLQREVEIQNTLFSFLTQQYEEAKIREAQNTPTVQVLDQAVKPIRRSWPQRTVMVLAAGFLSLIGGILVAFLSNYVEVVRAQKGKFLS